jgi:hypothetical protein
MIGGGWSLKFICDRMLGKLTTWLRIAGYDTLYVSELNILGDEDTYMLRNHRDRILITKDRNLYARCLKEERKAILIKSDRLAGQMKELQKLGISFEPVMDRCSVCNSMLRKPSAEEARRVMDREGISEDLAAKYELWYCQRCDKLYWMGSHWRNMMKFLKENNFISSKEGELMELGENLTKLSKLLHHWIEHSKEHTSKYLEWAEKVEAENPEIAELLRKAAKKFREGEEIFEKALERIEE